MSIDDRALHELIVESEDMQADALRDHRGVNADLAELRAERQDQGVDPDEVKHHTDHYNDVRRTVLRSSGLGLGAITAGFGAVFAGLMAGPAAAQDDDVDVLVLQTAASLENLAVATYKAALGLDFIKNGNPVVKAFAETTMKQHTEHGSAFNDTVKTLGGKQQTQTNPKYQKVVDDALPTLTDPAKVVALAVSLEQVATQTYNKNCGLMMDKDALGLMASVMGVEGQHLATLRAVGALLDGGAVDLIAIPTNLAKLPAAAGSVAFPEPFEGTDNASPPEEGAVK